MVRHPQLCGLVGNLGGHPKWPVLLLMTTDERVTVATSQFHQQTL